MNKITPESLESDRMRRWKERQKIATTYEDAAEILENEDDHKFRDVISHLKYEAESWRSR